LPISTLAELGFEGGFAHLVFHSGTVVVKEMAVLIVFDGKSAINPLFC
jgi:hypothetical protein